MSYRVLIAVLFVWLCGTLLGCFCEQASPSSTTVDKLNIVFSHAIFKFNTGPGLIAKVPVPNTEYFSTVWSILTWDFAFFPPDSPWQIIRWIFACIGAGVVFALLAQLLTSMTQSKFV